MILFRTRNLLLVAFVVLAGATSVYAQTGGLSGAAKDEKGQPLVGYTILLERQDIKGVYKVKTNKKGEYVYIGLPIGNYKVSLQDANARTVFFVTTRIGLGDPTPLDFGLARERSLQQQEQQKQLQANPELQKRMEDQAKEQKQLTGLKELFDAGQALYAEKRFIEAAGMFEQAIPVAKERNLAAVLSRAGDSYREARQYDKASDYYQKAVATSPTDPGYRNNLGDVYARMGKIAEAQQEFQKAAELDPTGASRYYFNLGVVMYNRGKMDEAAQALKKATELDPNAPDAYFLLAQALMGKATLTDDGRVIAVPGTVEALETYLKLDPNGKYAAGAQQTLLTLQGKVETQYKATKKKKG